METRDTVSGQDHLDQVLVKFAEGDRTAGFDALVKLWRAGFRPPSTFQVPRPYGRSAVDHAIVVGFAQGPLWADLIGGSPSQVSRACELAADLLVHLQRQPPGDAAAAPRSASGQVGRSDRRPGELAEDLSRAFPGCADRVRTLAARLDESLARGQGVLVAAHGDYHPKNVIVTDTTATMIDLDTYGAREPAFDVGYAIGQLLVMSQLRLGRLGPGFAAAERFWSGYSRAGSARWDRVSL
ncbi:MAG: phosphotransferase family protein, partial [Actinomycetes bacterium]